TGALGYQLAFFRERPSRVFMIDADLKADEIEHLRAMGVDLYRDPHNAALVAAREFLPRDIAETTLVYQYSSGAGLTKVGERDGAVVRIHYFILLREPMWPEHFKMLIRQHNAQLHALGFGKKVLDEQLYNAVQVHYIAPPEFEGGDPIP